MRKLIAISWFAVICGCQDVSYHPVTPQIKFTSGSGDFANYPPTQPFVILALHPHENFPSVGDQIHLTAADSDEIQRGTFAVNDAVSRYPKGFVEKYAGSVYLFHSIFDDDFGNCGGLCTGDGCILVCVLDTENTESVFHHELGHRLMEYCNHDWSGWTSFNPSNFKYIGGQGKNDIGQDEMLTEGFCTSYAMSNDVEDRAEVVKCMFSDPSTFWEEADSHERLKKKALAVIDFYHSLEPQFSEGYFRALTPKKPTPNNDSNDLGEFLVVCLVFAFVVMVLLLLLPLLIELPNGYHTRNRSWS